MIPNSCCFNRHSQTSMDQYSKKESMMDFMAVEIVVGIIIIQMSLQLG